MSKQHQIPNRKLAPKHGNPILLSIEDPLEMRLDNGFLAYIINAGDDEVTRFDIVVKAGSAYQKKSLAASSVGSLLMEGTKSYSSSNIANKLDYYGSYLDTSVTKDSATITLYTLTKHLDKLLPIVAEMLTDASFHQHELDTHLSMKRQEFLTNREKVKYNAILEFNRMVFGENSAYGQTLDIDDFDKINRDDLVTFFNTHYNIDNSYIIVSGNANDKIPGLLNKYFGNGFSKKKYNTKGPIQFTNTNGQKEKYIQKADAMQSAIRIGRPMINKVHPDYNKFVLLNTLLGGYFGSRLMSNLREDKGFTYGINSFNVNYRNAAAFSIATEVNANHTNAAIDEIFKEMNLLRQKKVNEEELQLVKNYIYGMFLRNFDGPFALSERFSSVKDFGLSFDYYLNSLNEILSITSDEILETANKYLNPDDMLKLVVGNID